MPENEDLDLVEEPEDPVIGLEEQSEDDSDGEDDSSDPFDLHFAQADERIISKKVTDIKKGEWTTKRSMMNSLRATIMTPDPIVTSIFQQCQRHSTAYS